MLILAVLVFCLVAGLVYLMAKLAANQRSQIQELTGQVSKLLVSNERLQLAQHNAPEEAPVLEGKVIGLCIEQDHQLPILVRLVQERVEAEDGVVVVLDQTAVDSFSAATKWTPDDSQPDVVVHGRVRCNNYKDIYYEADLTFLFSQGLVESILESPPNGARQANLAITIVKILKQTMEQEGRRSERRAALRELGD